MREPTIIGDATLYCGDCVDVVANLTNSVDAVVTSPPYDQIRDYGATAELPVACIPAIASTIVEGGIVMWNVADQTVNGSETGTSFRQALAFMETGLWLHDTMIYCKESVTFPDASRYLPTFEYMFVFSRGRPKHFNGLRDRKNKWAGTTMHGTDRQKNGNTTPIDGVGRNIPDYGLRYNWWVISNSSSKEKGDHPAPMPYKMATAHILTWTVPNETVLDPFTGSGTTGVACARLGRKFIGIEIEPRYFDIACKRIEEAQRQGDMFRDAPKAAPVSQGKLL